MITLTLLHPVQSTPVQSWSFENDPAIRIGRAVDNHVVLYSAVVSRYHVEVRQSEGQWEVVNLGTNGTYLDGKRISQAPLVTGNIIRLARSGPNIKVDIEGAGADTSRSDHTLESQVQAAAGSALAQEPSLPPAVALLEQEDSGEPDSVVLDFLEPAPISDEFVVSGQYSLFQQAVEQLPNTCEHERATPDTLICIDCGHPVKRLAKIGDYDVLKILSQAGSTMMAWRAGHTVILKTLPSDESRSPSAILDFQNQARLLCSLSHPGLPRFFEAFEQDGQPFLVSEMIYGTDLNTMVSEQGPIPQYKVIQWGIEICGVLDYLHSQLPAYVHGQVRPQNLFHPYNATGHSEVVLVDFCDVVGQPHGNLDTLSDSYAAPEQHSGENRPASDLYGLGATMLYLLTGQAPSVFLQLGDQGAHLEFEYRSNMSEQLAAVLHQLTHSDPDKRFASASAVSAALQNLL